MTMKFGQRILRHYGIEWCKPYFAIKSRFGVDDKCDRQVDRQIEL